MVSFLGVNYVQVRAFFSHVVEAISSSKDLGRLSDTLDWKIIYHVELGWFGEEKNRQPLLIFIFFIFFSFFFGTDFSVVLFNLVVAGIYSQVL